MANFMHRASGVFADGGFWSFGIDSSGSVSESSAEGTWAGAVAAFFADTNVKTYYSTGTELTLTSTSTASATWRQTTKTETTHAVSGTGTDAQLSTRTSMVCSFYTANATRWGRGRMFLPSPTYAVLGSATTGHLDATIAGNIASALTTMFGSIAAGGLNQLIHTEKETKDGIPPYTTSLITSRRLQGKLMTQRRRSDKIVVATYSV